MKSAGAEIISKKKKNKIRIQYNDITKALKSNPKNFWLNTAGFKKLFIE